MLQYAIIIALTIMIIPVFAENGMILNVNNFYSKVNEGDNQQIYGNITDSNGNPMSNVEVQVGFPTRSMLTNTNASGQFSMESPGSEKPGQYTVPISASTDRNFAEIQIQYTVTEKPITITKESKQAHNQTEIDPFSKMIKQLEQQKLENKQRKQNEKHQKSILEDRAQVQQNIRQDLQELEKKTEAHSPRNAFLGFLSDIDQSVRTLFWQQFLFTEKITDKAQKAKQNALDSGKSSLESTKIFQKKAAVSKKEIIEYNKKISIEYGNATLDTQEKFNQLGKIPRN